MANSKFEAIDLSWFVIFERNTSSDLCWSEWMGKKWYSDVVFPSAGVPGGVELTTLSSWEGTSCELITFNVFLLLSRNLVFYLFFIFQNPQNYRNQSLLCSGGRVIWKRCFSLVINRLSLEGLGIEDKNIMCWGYVGPEQLFCNGCFSPQHSGILYCLCSFGSFWGNGLCSAAEVHL